ncbi:penicillin-binding protein 1A [Synechococcus elongatus]|uniref:transglycosylase domain-containing protein n=1 Tax=Synechococcus elongatus TaxID=32046 RepID=UPI0030CF3EA4
MAKSSAVDQTSDRPATSPSFLGRLAFWKARPETNTTRTRKSRAERRQAHRAKRAARPPGRRRWLRAIVVVAIGAATVAGAEVGRRRLIQQLPNPREVYSFTRPGTITILSADDVVLQKIGPATRDKVPFDQIPLQLRQAFLAAEDQRFYEHSGLDLVGIARASVTNLLSGEVQEGASTITQQLARIVFLSQERSIQRKFNEALMAQKLEQELTKDQILEQYLNLVYLGAGAYGVADAAWVYFSKPVKDLSLGEMATLAGLPPAPTAYSPLVSLKIAQERRNIVLSRMQEVGFITPAEAEAARREPLALKPASPKYAQSIAPYFTNYVRQELPRFVSPDVLEYGGLTLKTTLNYRWQKAADQAIQDSTYGSLQGALVSIDPRSGAIRAMVGGVDFDRSQFNRATQAYRQPGSTFKMFVYAAAIASGMSPSQIYVDAPLNLGGYKPQNFSRSFSGAISLTQALTNSVNIVAIKVLRDVGIDNVIRVARQMGIRADLARYYPLALGASDVTLLEITSAYGTLANRGQYLTPHPIAEIIDHRGRRLYQDKQIEPVQALDPGSAALVTSMLERVVTSGTGAAAYLPDRPVAGKTGTTEQARDLWFIGYIPQLVTGVWLGYDNFAPTGSGSSAAAVAWYRFMAQAIKDLPPEKFPPLPKPEQRKPLFKAQFTSGRDLGGIDRGPGRYDYGAGIELADSPSFAGSLPTAPSGGSTPNRPSPDYEADFGQEPAFEEPRYYEPPSSSGSEPVDQAPAPAGPEPEPEAPVEPQAPAPPSLEPTAPPPPVEPTAPLPQAP